MRHLIVVLVVLAIVAAGAWDAIAPTVSDVREQLHAALSR